jgi:tRNA pseudouridine38-40 synthase
MKIAFGVEYCGTAYFGWQRQAISPTIQECIEVALSKVADQQITVHCAGRTDTGVHAIQQVIHIETDASREEYSWIFGANANLPDDISLLWAKQVEDDFHARFSATSRVYRYIILNRPTRSGLAAGKVTWEYRALNEKHMQEAASHLIGEHDFTSYRAISCQAKTPVRHVKRLDIYREGDYVFLEIEADSFLQHMVRNIAGVVMAIGMGKEPVIWSKKVLDACDRIIGGVTAPADGLYLIKIEYPEKFDIPKPDLASCSYRP